MFSSLISIPIVTADLVSLCPVNILINIVLLGSKVAAVLLSNSISLLASAVDSALDFLSTLIIWGTSVAAADSQSPNSKTRYPTGKKRFESLGVLIFRSVHSSHFPLQKLLSLTLHLIQAL